MGPEVPDEAVGGPGRFRARVGTFPLQDQIPRALGLLLEVPRDPPEKRRVLKYGTELKPFPAQGG